MHLLTLSLLILGGLLAWKWLQNQPTATRKSAGLKVVLGGLGVLVLLGVLTGRLNPMTLLITAVAAVPMLGKLLDAKQLFDRFRSSSGPSGQQQSSVSTRFLEMTLEHDSGQMHGRVVSGRFSGRSLADLELAELMTLYRECSGDPQSAQLLATYLDRTLGERWRDAAGAQSGRDVSTQSMSLEEARKILGLNGVVTRERIIAAHRSLMQKLHPDRGGSTYLAAQVNQAKEVLLASL